ncbi:MAG: hypothetical protein ACM3SU_10115 [Acidobacteriota bacterium]
MKRFLRTVPVALLALALAPGCSSSGGGSHPSGAAPAGAATAPQATRETTASEVLNLASMLTGTFEGSTPGNELAVIVTGTVSPASATVYNLPVRVTGKYQDAGAREQGVIRLENQGRSVSLTYIPHFDPTAGLISSEALAFTPQELEAACNFDVVPRGDGFYGLTLGQTTCARAIRGAVGKWSFEVEPGSIRVRNAGTGETLRFRRTSK